MTVVVNQCNVTCVFCFVVQAAELVAHDFSVWNFVLRCFDFYVRQCGLLVIWSER
jgi:hypothetical protein